MFELGPGRHRVPTQHNGLDGGLALLENNTLARGWMVKTLTQDNIIVKSQ